MPESPQGYDPTPHRTHIPGNREHHAGADGCRGGFFCGAEPGGKARVRKPECHLVLRGIHHACHGSAFADAAARREQGTSLPGENKGLLLRSSEHRRRYSRRYQ